MTPGLSQRLAVGIALTGILCLSCHIPFLPERSQKPFPQEAPLASVAADEVESNGPNARPDKRPGRPRIGLVLSGGGARGAAHVGVIEILEELQIPVDFVVGTSMGAIVGGLYASGYSPEEMSAIIRDADWPELMSDAPPRNELWFRRRQDNREFQVDLEFGWKGGSPVLPPGLILGRNVESFLEQLTLPVAGVENFDQLRIPYRCVATDLADGSAVVFEDGNLAKAIRASMSLPGIFAPVEHEGRMLVDGGAVDNIPVDVARNLGADIVIAVDISTPLGEIKSNSSPLSVFGQVIGILMSKNRENAMSLITDKDVSITPELGNISVLAFDRTVEAIEIGRDAANGARAKLMPLGVEELDWNEFLESQRRPERGPLRVRNISIDRQTRLSAAILRHFSALREGEPLDADALERTRIQLGGIGLFEGIEVDVVPVPGSTDEVDVVLRPIEKSWGPNYLRFGLGISSDFSGDGEFDFGFQHTLTPLNEYGGEWRNEVLVGTRTRLYTELYQPLDSGLRWFVAPNIEFFQDNLALRLDGTKVAEVSIASSELALAVGRNLGSWGELRSTFGWIKGTARPEISSPGFLPTKVDVSGKVWSTRLQIDTLDSITFPRNGTIGAIEYQLTNQSLSGTGSLGSLQGELGVPLTSDRLTVYSSLEGGITLDGDGPQGTEFQLGGFRRLSGLSPRELVGNHYALAVIQPYYQLSSRTGLLGMASYVGASLEYGGFWEDSGNFSTSDFLLGGSAYLGLDTLLGPVFIGIGLGEGGERTAFVFIGPTF